MSQLVLPYNIINNTPADAVQVDTNYDVIAAHVNSQVINRDGSISMDAPLLLKGDPTAPLHAATMAYVDAVLPIGIIMVFGGVAAPAGQWLLCDGSTRSQSTYKTLYDVLGTRYNVGTVAAGNFMLPNLKGRFPIGFDSTQTGLNVVGEQGGTWNVPVPPHAHPMPHTHTMAHTHEMPHLHSIAHDHPSTATSTDAVPTRFTSVHVDGTAPSAFALTTTASPNTSGTGSDYAHDHTLNLPNYTGNSGQPDDATTNASSAANTGAVSAANTANNTDALTTGTIATTHMPPYLTVQFIIRAA